ncbi:MAG: hypothetical protein M0R50_08390 [Candidatus Cloacimonetes bacterium]|nr:hypothetical protein [Candidatus Cloacimonadota bacterium]
MILKASRKSTDKYWTLVGLDKWVSQEGSPAMWKTIYDIAKGLPEVKKISDKLVVGERNIEKFSDKLNSKLPLFSAEQVANLFDFDDLGGTTSSRGIWYKNLFFLNNIRESNPRTPAELAHAIDKMVQMMHHNSMFLIYTSSDFKKSLDAVNAKFNASDPSEYWVYVDDYIRRSINKIRRKELGIDIILPTKVSKKKLFAHKSDEDRWDEGEDEESNAIPVDASILRRMRKGEQVQYESPKNAYNYALLQVKGRWPEGEKIILQDAWAILPYAEHIIKGRWPEGEKAILELKNDRVAVQYAIRVIKGKWPEAEKLIANDATNAFYYARDVLKKRWKPAEEAIIQQKILTKMMTIHPIPRLPTLRKSLKGGGLKLRKSYYNHLIIGILKNILMV